jgi:hypothetical protein
VLPALTLQSRHPITTASIYGFKPAQSIRLRVRGQPSRRRAPVSRILTVRPRSGTFSNMSVWSNRRDLTPAMSVSKAAERRRGRIRERYQLNDRSCCAGNIQPSRTWATDRSVHTPPPRLRASSCSSSVTRSRNTLGAPCTAISSTHVRFWVCSDRTRDPVPSRDRVRVSIAYETGLRRSSHGQQAPSLSNVSSLRKSLVTRRC